MENKLVEPVNQETITALEHHFINLLTPIPSDAGYLGKMCKSQAINSKAEELSEKTLKICTYIKDNSNYIPTETYGTPEEQIAVILGNVYCGISNKVNKILNLAGSIKKEMKSNQSYDDNSLSECINQTLDAITKISQFLEKIKHGVPYKTEEYSPTSKMLILPKPNKNQ